jgi:hypothetical protein
MKIVLASIAIALAGCSTTGVQESAGTSQSAATGDELSDLSTMTFDCPKAALNAAAREAAKVKSQGRYQFALFNIVNDSHHATYEVHFKSNYQGEKELKYCVAIYCQQGWDPRNTHVTVKRMGDGQQHAGAVAHGTDCAGVHAAAKRKN